MKNSIVRESPAVEPILLSKRSVARMLSISTRTIDNLVASKRLPVRRIGRRALIPRAAVEALARRDTPSPTREAAEVRDGRSRLPHEPSAKAARRSRSKPPGSVTVVKPSAGDHRMNRREL